MAWAWVMAVWEMELVVMAVSEMELENHHTTPHHNSHTWKLKSNTHRQNCKMTALCHTHHSSRNLLMHSTPWMT